jgi:ABC-type transport system involved in multi-copper enzyme maturation permease subunit
MLLHIIKHELADHFRSLRLSLTILLVSVTMTIAGFVFVGDYQETVSNYNRNVNNSQQLLREYTKRNRALFYVTGTRFQSVYKSPNPLQFIAEGRERYLADSCETTAFVTEGPIIKNKSNFMLFRYISWDWVFVVGTIMSFAAITLAYDAISGEREQGTLRLVMSYPIPKATFLFAKYIATMVSLLVPLAVGMALNLLIINLSPLIELTAADWAKIITIVAVSFIYISVFIALSLFVSSLVRASSTSLAILLLVWVILVLIIPQTDVLFARQFYKLPDQKAVATRMAEDIRKVPTGNLRWSGADELPDDGLSLGMDVGDAWNGGLKQYRNALWGQVKLARNITRISPAADYAYAAEAVASTGIYRLIDFSNRVEQYRLELLEFARNEVKKNKRDKALNYAIEYDTIPKFVDKIPPLSNTVISALYDILLLVLFNFAFFLGAYTVFLRRDV